MDRKDAIARAYRVLEMLNFRGTVVEIEDGIEVQVEGSTCEGLDQFVNYDNCEEELTNQLTALAIEMDPENVQFRFPGDTNAWVVMSIEL